jgi:hypothetical protein
LFYSLQQIHPHLNAAVVIEVVYREYSDRQAPFYLALLDAKFAFDVFLYMGERSPTLISSGMEYCEIMLLIKSSIYNWKYSPAYIIFSIDNPYMFSDLPVLKQKCYNR